MTSALRRKGLPNSSMTTRVTNTIKPSPRYLQSGGQDRRLVYFVCCSAEPEMHARTCTLLHAAGHRAAAKAGVWSCKLTCMQAAQRAKEHTQGRHSIAVHCHCPCTWAQWRRRSRCRSCTEPRPVQLQAPGQTLPTHADA